MTTVEPITSQLSSGETVTVRSAVPSDAQQRIALYRSIVEEGRLTLATPDSFSRSESDEREAIERMTGRDGSLCLVTVVGNELIGTLEASTGDNAVDAHFCDIKDVWVRKDWRRRGIGSLLMSRLIEWADTTPQIEKLALFVMSTSEPARRMYEKHGFEVEGRGVRDMKFGPGDYADTIFMGRFVDA